MTTRCVIKAVTDFMQIVSSVVCGNKFIFLDIHATLLV